VIQPQNGDSTTIALQELSSDARTDRRFFDPDRSSLALVI